MEAIEIIALSISSALATACGIGGGAVYSSFLLGVQDFEPSEAFPISICIIMFCGVITFINRIIDKYEHPKTNFVNYELSILFGPAMILGVKFGTICNMILNKMILTFLLAAILVNSIFKNLKNIHKTKEKEEKYDQELLMAENNGGLEEALIPKSQRKTFNEIISNTERGQILTSDEKSLLKQDEMPLRPGRLAFILVLQILLLGDQLLEGNLNLSSWIGVVRCSSTYWFIFGGYIVVSIIMLLIGYKMAKTHFNLRRKLPVKYSGLKLDYLNDHIYSIIFNAFLTGLMSPTVGIGGGMILNPILANLGLEPKEASSTSNFLIISNSIASTILFLCSGQLNFTFTILLGTPCIICAFIGSFFILSYISRTKKSSFLLVIMFYIMISSLFLLGFKIYLEWDNINIGGLLMINPYC